MDEITILVADAVAAAREVRADDLTRLIEQINTIAGRDIAFEIVSAALAGAAS